MDASRAQAGNYACFAIVPQGMTTAIGIFQVRSLEPGFGTAEWGFAMGSQFWGTGMFTEGARLVLDFAFDVIGAQRLEARAAVANGRGNGALRKIGAVQEGVLRRSFLRHGQHHDQVLWGILAEDWRLQRVAPAARRRRTNDLRLVTRVRPGHFQGCPGLFFARIAVLLFSSTLVSRIQHYRQ